MPYLLVIFGALVNLAFTSTYIWQTLRGKTKPNKVTFLLWSIAPAIGAVAAFENGVMWPALAVFVAALCPFLIFLASFVNPNAHWRLTPLDYICGGLSLAALALWYVTHEPVIAILFAILSDAFATFPTLMKAWKYPETESALSYFGSTINALTGLLAAQSWTFSAVAFPMYLFIAMGLTGIGAMRKGRIV